MICRFEVLKTVKMEYLEPLAELFLQADFMAESDGSEWLVKAVENSLLAVGAFDESGALVGFARVLGDGVSDCYIQDVTVSTRCRHQGIGRQLMQFVLDELKSRNIDWVGLIATPGKEAFYRQLGFEVMSDHTPMLLALDSDKKNSDKITLTT